MGHRVSPVRGVEAIGVTMPDYAIVAIGYESQAEWDGFFESVSRSTSQPKSIVVVDNSPQPSLVASRWRSLPLSVLHTPENPGYGAAANKGMAEVGDRVDWVVICNPDVRLFPATMEDLLSERTAFDQAAVLGPCVLTSEGSVYPSAREIPGLRIGVGHALFSQIWPSNPWTARYLGTYGIEEPRSVGWLSGSFLLVNREVFEKIGGFDEDFFMFFEDVDLGRRIKRAGYRNVYVPRAKVTHSGAHATSTRQKEMVLAHHHSAEKFLARLYPHAWQGIVRVALRAGLRMRAWWESRNLD